MIAPVLQHQSAECGLACLAMVCRAHGQWIELSDLRLRFPMSAKGTSLKQLMTMASSLGLTPRAVRLELDELKQLPRPCILHWDFAHFVVLWKVTRQSVVVFDPAIGRRTLSTAQVSAHFTGVALELTPAAKFDATPKHPPFRLSALTGRIKGLRGSLLQILAIALTLEAFSVAAPLVNQTLLDEALTGHDHTMLVTLVAGFALLFATQSALGLARSWMSIVLGQSLHLQWTSNVFAHLIRLPPSWFSHRSLGDISSRFGAITSIQQTLTAASLGAVLDGVMAIGALVMMCLYAPTLAEVVVAAVALYALLRWASFAPLREATAERVVASARESSHFLETLRAIQPLKLFGREQSRRARWQHLVVEVQNRDVRTARMAMALSTAQQMLFGAEGLVVLWLGAEAVMASQEGTTSASQRLTVGMLFAFLAYKDQFTGRMAALINFAADFRMLKLHTDRLSDIACAAPESTKVEEALKDLSYLPASVELRDVSFRYGEGEPWVLRHASFKIAAGDCVAITGTSGAGKSTLMKLMLGLLSPTEGEVLFGGVPVQLLGLPSVRRCIGTVMQDDSLLTGSLAENICFFDDEPDMGRIESCARAACIHEDILRMPMAYHTLVGDLGTGLSGGQVQRLLLARALYKQPRILALDEATSHLDVSKERAVTAALAQMHLTRIVIAHRAETIAGARRVVELHDGKLRELAHLQGDLETAGT